MLNVRYNVRSTIDEGIDSIMTNTNITNLRKNLFGYINQAIEFDEVVNVNTKSGNAVIISESEYNSIMETLYLSSDPRVKSEILEGINTPLVECIPESEVLW